MGKLIVPSVAVQRQRRLTGNRADDLTGREFGRLTAKTLYGVRKTGTRTATAYWICRCNCGQRLVVNRNNLVSGHATSCGCLKRDILVRRNFKHGLRALPEFCVWAGMLNRCYNVKNRAYDDYGGRGIKVCRRWQHPRRGFLNFLADMGPRPSKHTLDRKHVDRDYSPRNCRWATAVEQANNKRTNRFLTLDGRRQTLATWARELGIKPITLLGRLRVWPLRKALTTRKLA